LSTSLKSPRKGGAATDGESALITAMIERIERESDEEKRGDIPRLKFIGSALIFLVKARHIGVTSSKPIESVLWVMCGIILNINPL